MESPGFGGGALHFGGASARPQWKSRWRSCLERPQAVSGNPQLGATLSTVPVDDKASRCCPEASNSKRGPRGPKATWRVATDRHGRQIEATRIGHACQEVVRLAYQATKMVHATVIYRVGTISRAESNVSPASERRPRSNVAKTPLRRFARANRYASVTCR